VRHGRGPAIERLPALSLLHPRPLNRGMSFTIQITTQPTSEPVTTSDLHAWLRLNTTDEDAILASLITTARQQFEHLTQRAVLPTTFRQYTDRIRHGVTLLRGPVTSITGVHYYDGNDNLQTDSTYSSDIVSLPARIRWINPLTISLNVRPPVYVDFVAGWADTSHVPVEVCTAIKLLAASYYETRSAYVTDNLKELPRGFAAVCAKYALSLDGDWSHGGNRWEDRFREGLV